MTRNRRECYLTACLSVLLLTACITAPVTSSIKGALIAINYSACDKKAKPTSETFTFRMKSPNRLYITHSGAEFNCCINSLAAEVDYTKSQIVINEREVYGPVGSCLCTCRYDIEYEIPVIYGDYSVIVRNDSDRYIKSAEFRLKLDDGTDVKRNIDLPSNK